MRVIGDWQGVVPGGEDQGKAPGLRTSNVSARFLSLGVRTAAGVQVSRAPLSQPTWTGRHGVAGAPRAPPPRGAAAGGRGGGAASPANGSGGGGGGGAGPAGKRPRFGQVQAAQRPAAAAINAVPARPAAGAAAQQAGGGGAAAAGSPSGAGLARGRGLSSSALLEQVRARQQQLDGLLRPLAGGEAGEGAAGAAGAAGGGGGDAEVVERGGGSGGGGGGVEAQLLAAELVAYLERHGGEGREVGSAQLTAAFRARMPEQLFRQLLGQVASYVKRSSGGSWRLKQEFWGASG